MTEKTHYITGVLTALIYVHATKAPVDQIVIGAIAGSDLPDIDQYFSALKHRKVTHSLLFPSLFLGIEYFYHSGVLLGLVIGWVIHIFMDMMNGKGVCLFYPIKKNFNILDIKYNGTIEKIIRSGAIAGIIVVITMQIINTFNL